MIFTAIAAIDHQMIEDELYRRLRRNAREVESRIAAALRSEPGSGEVARPERLLAAMRHGALNGGKRIRPFLLVEAAAMLGTSGEAALRVAAALECVHCYSLIHDDLPAMDDDDIRRGKPTVHRAFDEATAILAGDSLLTLAFDLIASPETELLPASKTELVLGLARSAGLGGMAGGQMLDLDAADNPLDEAGIIRMQAMKTGALFRFACEAGAIVADAPPADRERLSEFGSAIGLAFQIADDLLDATGDAERVGKATGKDAAAGKSTLTGLHGVEWARTQLGGLVEQAVELLDPYGARANILAASARYIAGRET